LSAPTTLSTLVTGGYDQYSVDLTWHTDSANTDVSYEYDIRYSTSPITEGNYLSAAEAQLTPVYHSDLDPEGTERNYIVAGLSRNTTYYFAVKSKHQTSDWSTVSNIVSAKTTTGASVSNESAHSGQTASSGGGSNHVREEYGSSSGGNAAFSFEPTTLKAEPADNQIIFEWNNPGEENFVRTVVVRKEGSYPSSPSDGQTIYEGRSETFTDTNVTNGKTYYYALYSYNHSKTYSAPVRVSLAPKTGNTQIKFNESGSLKSVLPVMHFVHSHKRGDKDIEVEHLQEVLALENVSFPENLITGYFGSITENALKKFQVKHGLPVTGIVDTATQKKLNTVSQAETRLAIPGDFVVFSTDMKLGDRGEAVKDLQEFLVYEGSYTQALVSGYFGSLTRNAVMKFQRKYSITPVSGYVGYKTRHRMQQLTGF
jgi:peptidoglycan hydrolase-like protein with peptidoglycan-binding domain